MRYLVFSDLHGDSVALADLLNVYNKGSFDKILCLGDILYHGPRNDLPKGYNPKECIKLLNMHKDEIIAVRGNCDAYVDQMVLDFYIHDEYEIIENGKRIIMTHGHIINPDNYLNINSGVVLYGHTHIHKMDNICGVLYLNPGSVSLPKGGQDRSYAILDSDSFEVFNFNGESLLKVSI